MFRVLPVCNACFSFSKCTSCHNFSICDFTSSSSAACRQENNQISPDKHGFMKNKWLKPIPPACLGEMAFLVRDGLLQQSKEKLRRRTGAARWAMTLVHTMYCCKKNRKTLERNISLYYPCVCLSGFSPSSGSNPVCVCPNIRRGWGWQKGGGKKWFACVGFIFR